MAFRYDQVSEADTAAKSWHGEDGSLEESAGVRATSSLPCGTSAIHLRSLSRMMLNYIKLLDAKHEPLRVIVRNK